METHPLHELGRESEVWTDIPMRALNWQDQQAGMSGLPCSQRPSGMRVHGSGGMGLQSTFCILLQTIIFQHLLYCPRGAQHCSRNDLRGDVEGVVGLVRVHAE